MIMERRDVLRLGIVALAAGGPRSAWAQRLRILDGGPRPGGRVVESSATSGDLQRVVSGLAVGERRQHETLSVFWLHGAPGASLDVLTLDEASSRGTLLVTEGAQATVPELVVENKGSSHVLMLAGEILVGGKQHRVLTENILLPPASGPRPIGVYCVEQGRWEAGRTSFGAKGSFAAPSLRSQLLARTDQRRVWHEVDRQAREAGVASLTASYQAIYEDPDVRTQLGAVEHSAVARPASGAVGAVVFVGPRAAGLDLFFDAGLFAREWDKLLRAHALEAYRQRQLDVPAETGLRARARETLAAAGVKGDLRESAGVGRIFEFRAQGLHGMALMFKSRVVHAAIV